MPSKRIKQINELIKEELGSIIAKEIEFPSDCLVTISKVVTGPDLKHANIWLSVLPISKHNDVLSILALKRGGLQVILNKRLRTRNSPKIHFKIDETEEKAAYIEQLLDTIKK